MEPRSARQTEGSKLVHPFLQLCTEEEGEFNRRLMQFNLAQLRARRIQNIINAVGRRFPRIRAEESQPGVVLSEEKQKIVDYIIEAVNHDRQNWPGLIHSTTDKKTVDNLKRKLLEGAGLVTPRGRRARERASQIIALKRKDLDAAGVQLISAYFGNEARQGVKHASLARALPSAVIYSSGHQDMSNAYFMHGLFEENPENERIPQAMLEQINSDLNRASEIRHRVGTIAPDLIAAAHNKLTQIYASRWQAFREAPPDSDKAKHKDVYQTIGAQYPEFLHHVTRLYENVRNIEHANVLLDYLFSKEGRTGAHTLRRIEMFANSLEKQNRECGYGHTHNTLAAVAELWNDPKRRWILPEKTSELIPAMERLSELFQAHRRYPSRVSTALRNISEMASLRDRDGMQIGRNFMRHVATLTHILEDNRDDEDSAIQRFTYAVVSLGDGGRGQKVLRNLKARSKSQPDYSASKVTQAWTRFRKATLEKIRETEATIAKIRREAEARETSERRKKQLLSQIRREYEPALKRLQAQARGEGMQYEGGRIVYSQSYLRRSEP